MTRFEEIMNNEEFVNNLDNATSYEEFAGMFEKEGVNIEEMLPAEEEEAELSEDDLEDVTGGLSAKDLKRIVKASIKAVKNPANVFKWGAACGILLRAYYDIEKYGDATHTYSEKQITKAAKTIGCM